MSILTLVIAIPWPGFSSQVGLPSTGIVSGNLNDHTAPLAVPPNNIRPECDKATVDKVVSPTGIFLTTWIYNIISKTCVIENKDNIYPIV